jgi:hypothetical protein
LRPRCVPRDEGANPARWPDHQQRLCLCLCAPTELGPFTATKHITGLNKSLVLDGRAFETARRQEENACQEPSRRSVDALKAQLKRALADVTGRFNRHR